MRKNRFKENQLHLVVIDPIFNDQTRISIEVRLIVGDQRDTQCNRVGGDQQVGRVSTRHSHFTSTKS